MKTKFVIGMTGLALLLIILNVSVDSSVKTQNVKVFVDAVSNISTPLNNTLYLSRQIPINITTNGAVELRYSDNWNSFRTICRRGCSNFLTKKPFDDGKHHLVIESIYSEAGLVLTSIIDFFVDTKKPNIRNIIPKSGFANGSFNLVFQEVNTEKVKFYYGNDNLGRKEMIIDLDKCYYKNYFTYCDINVDVSEYDQSKIDFWFDIEDIANNRVQSKILFLKVDLKKPVINSFDYNIDKRNVIFEINVSDLNFDSIKYSEETRFALVWKTLCSSLNNGLCKVKRSFSQGIHTLNFRISDDAGNYEEKSISFEIA